MQVKTPRLPLAHLSISGNVGGFVGRGRSPSVLADDRVLQFSRRDRRYLLLRLQPPIHLFGLFVDKGNQLVKLTITDEGIVFRLQDPELIICKNVPRTISMGNVYEAHDDLLNLRLFFYTAKDYNISCAV
ncbi:hypothetical protein SDJN03_04792, partial [Cucurbita argyrosperma subsp. sororia]